MPFLFENLDAYKKSILLIDMMHGLCDNLAQSGISSMLDQLKRSSLSIALNIAEGSGRSGKKEKSRYYKIGRGSLHETVPIIEILHRRRFINEQIYLEAYNLADEVGRLLNGLIRKTENPSYHRKQGAENGEQKVV